MMLLVSVLIHVRKRLSVTHVNTMERLRNTLPGMGESLLSQMQQASQPVRQQET